MKKIALTILCLIMGGCSPIKIDGYYRNPFSLSDIIWEHPVDFDSDEEQVFVVPYIKYASAFSLCYDELDWDFDKYGSSPDSITYLPHDKVKVSFEIGDSLFVRDEKKSLSFTEFGCPVDGRVLFNFYMPDDFDRETGGILRFKVLERSFLKGKKMKIVLIYSKNGFK